MIKAQKYVDLGAYNEKSEDYKAKVKQTGLGERLTKLTNVSLYLAKSNKSFIFLEYWLSKAFL